MTEMSIVIDITAVLQAINSQHSTRFIPQERYPHGEQGAVRLTDPAGKDFVLKFSPDLDTIHRYQRAEIITELLRPTGYPAPVYVALGCTETVAYAIQEALPGTPLTSFAAPLVNDILRINAYQAQRLVGEHSQWPAPVIEPTLFGGNGFCLLEPMQHYSSQTSELLHELQQRMQTASRYRYPTHDVVHFDYNPYNILVEGTTIRGIIDWDGWCWGDRMFDLATLLFYSNAHPSPCLPLWTEICHHVGPAIGSIYLAHIIHRQVDWSIRHHDQATIDHWLAVAQTTLDRFVVP